MIVQCIGGRRGIHSSFLVSHEKGQTYSVALWIFRQVLQNLLAKNLQKLMGRLRFKRKTEKLGGKKWLRKSVIKKLTILYHLAIRRNIDSVKDMKQTIIATLFHYCSTDKNPDMKIIQKASRVGVNCARLKRRIILHLINIRRD